MNGNINRISEMRVVVAVAVVVVSFNFLGYSLVVASSGNQIEIEF